MTIERGIPLPRKTPGKPLKYPWRDMAVGSSIFIEGGEQARSAALSSASSRKRNLPEGFKLASRKAEKDGKKGFRIWRVA